MLRKALILNSAFNKPEEGAEPTFGEPIHLTGSIKNFATHSVRIDSYEVVVDAMTYYGVKHQEVYRHAEWNPSKKLLPMNTRKYYLLLALRGCYTATYAKNQGL